ncbi:MAG: hypothetical protein WBV89_16355 [Ilumatobacter sp.]
MHIASSLELDDVGLDVEDGRGVDGVETFDGDREVGDIDEFTGGDAESVGSGLGGLGENADEWPVAAFPWAPCPEVDLGRLDTVEQVHDLASVVVLGGDSR